MKKHHVIVIGTSAGGVQALKTIVRSLPKHFPASVHIVQHISNEAFSNLPQVLAKTAQLPVAFAQDKELIEPSHIYIAPPDYHLLLEENRLRVIRGPRENRMRPAIDPLFRSAAVSYRSYTTGIILTGMLDDGTAGLQAIKACGGIAIVQDPKEAKYPSMPKSAIANVAVDRIVSFKEIPPLLLERVQEKPARVTQIPADLLLEVPISRDAITTPETMAKIGTPVAHSCPSCGGPLWQIGDKNPLLRYRCHVGHAFTSHALIEEQNEATEKALWVALRTLEERSRLLKSMSDRYAQNGSDALVKVHLERSQEALEHAVQIRNLIRNLRTLAESSPEKKSDKQAS
ncbi:MAG: chemotaxis protein CheB [Pleurocapsa sp.]